MEKVLDISAMLRDQFVSPKQAALALGMNLKSIRSAIKSKRIKFQKVGKVIYIAKQDMESFRLNPPRAKPGPKRLSFAEFWRKIGVEAGWKVNDAEEAQGEYFFPKWSVSSRQGEGDIMDAMNSFLEGFQNAMIERRAQTKGE